MKSRNIGETYRIGRRNSLIPILFLLGTYNAYAAAPDLKTAAQFGVLASTGVTNADSRTTIRGSVGSAPASPSVTGLTASMVTGGTLYTTPNAVTAQAQMDATAAYGVAAGAACAPAHNLTGQDLGGMTLTAGASNVYCFTSSAGLTGTLTLVGGPGDVFIFQIGSTLITGSNSKVSLVGVSPCNVFWQVGSSATIQVNNSFVGNILAHTSITLNGGTLTGRALANTGAVTISGKETVISGCSVTPPQIVLAPASSSSVCGSNAVTVESATVLSNGLPLVGVLVTFKITSGPGLGTYGPVATDAAGVASFSVPPLALLSGPDSIMAQFTDASSVTWTSNTTTVSCVAPVTSDTTAPTVDVVAVVPGPPKQVVISVQDTGSGLASVVVTNSTNATVFVPPFVNGTVDVLGVTATKLDESQPAIVGLTVTDVAGNVTMFDPVYATITIAASKSKSQQIAFTHHQRTTLGGVAPSEGTMLIQNGDPGVSGLVITVNNRWRFVVALSSRQSVTLDISAALSDGTNTLRVDASGAPGSSVDLVVSDGKQ
jgi:hypothetical protein